MKASDLPSSAAAPRLDRLLVAVDFSPASLQAVDYVGVMASRLGSRASLLHVVEPELLLGDLRNFPFGVPEAEADQEAGQRLRRWMQHRLPPAVRGDPLVCRGRPVPRIIETVRGMEVDLLVLARSQPRGLSRLLGHRRVKQIVRLAPCPVLILPAAFLARHPLALMDTEAVPGRRVLLPVDGSGFSRVTLRWSVALAEPAIGILNVLYVPGLYEVPPENGAAPHGALPANAAEVLEQKLWVCQKITAPRDLSVNLLPQPCPATAESLSAVAIRERCDLMVLRSQETSLWERLTRGSLVEELAVTAPCPVLCIPTRSGDATPMAPGPSIEPAEAFHANRQVAP